MSPLDSTTTLDEVPVGAQATVRSLDAPREVAQRLQEMGLVPGTDVIVVKYAPLGDPMELRLRGYHLAVRRADAAYVRVANVARVQWITGATNPASPDDAPSIAAR